MNFHHGLITAGQARRILLRGEGEKTGRYLLRHVSSGEHVISVVRSDEVVCDFIMPAKESNIVKRNPHLVTLSETVRLSQYLGI